MQTSTIYVSGCEIKNPGKMGKQEWLLQYGQSNVILSCSARSTFFPTRWNPLSLKCAFNGKMIYETGSTVYALNDDKILLLNQDTEFTAMFPCEENFESFSINFSPPFLSLALASFLNDPEKQLSNPLDAAGSSFIERTYRYNEKIGQHIKRIHGLTRIPGADNNVLDDCMLALLGSLLQLHGSVTEEIDRLPYQKTSTRIELYKRVQLAREYADACFHLDCTVGKLSQVAMLNHFYFIRVFKKHFGVSPHQYITNRRIEEARLLLKKGFPVTDTCRKVGFEDLCSFSRLFKRKTGISPVHYSRLGEY